MKTAKERSFIKRMALSPKTSPTETSLPFNRGGVWGRENAKRPSMTEAITPKV